MLFRKKTITIEAFRFEGDTESAYDIINWAGSGCGIRSVSQRGPIHKTILAIETLEGEMRAQRGDWIIKGVHGEFYPCKPDIFEETYEPVRASP